MEHSGGVQRSNELPSVCNRVFARFNDHLLLVSEEQDGQEDTAGDKGQSLSNDIQGAYGIRTARNTTVKQILINLQTPSSILTSSNLTPILPTAAEEQKPDVGTRSESA